MSMSLTEIEKALIALKVKVDVQNYEELVGLINKSCIEALWDYETLRIHVTQTVDGKDKLKEMGELGWELVALVPNQYPDPLRSFECFFKRRTR